MLAKEFIIHLENYEHQNSPFFERFVFRNSLMFPLVFISNGISVHGAYVGRNRRVVDVRLCSLVKGLLM